ncbi:hypothetical protein K438DRAFT_1749388 [Mycena galopus ATCC 62051]|nr:hypothetical protein K438DRAFT_1749388 [Mycena galopus ATCC 62051]
MAASPPNIRAKVDKPAAPLAYAFPDTFTIGNRRTKPFVNASQIEDHLALLYAFTELKISVEGMAAAEIPHLPSDNERRWAWFEMWCKVLQPSAHSEQAITTMLPPIDVLMVWHAYLLNPGWYAEDGERIETLKGLHQAGNQFAALLGHGLGELLVVEPSQKRIDNWVKMTATPFDPFEFMRQIIARQIACPKCRAVVYAPYLTKNGTGYLQQGFTMKCISPRCGFEITREGLALRKFARDLARTTPKGKASELLAGTVHTPINVLNLERGRLIKSTMLSSYTLKRPAGSKRNTLISDEAYADFLLEKGKYSQDKLKGKVAKKMKRQGGNLINRIMSAYVDDKLFSVELVGAILRQGSFVTKMYDLQWTNPGFFAGTEDEIALQHAIARYHAFLDLMSSSPTSFFVPTLDIDLAWHTHQLMASSYSTDTIKYVGRFIDHDDKVEESQLASSFDNTCRAWKTRFAVEYTHCGCPVPGKTIGQRLSLLVTQATKPPHLIPPNRDDLLAATHPSDHNAVFAFHNKAASEAAQRRRREKIADRRQRDTALDFGRAQMGKRSDQSRRNVRHDPAFLIPIPLHYTPVMAGCAASTGNIINGGTGFGGALVLVVVGELRVDPGVAVAAAGVPGAVEEEGEGVEAAAAGVPGAVEEEEGVEAGAAVEAEGAVEVEVGVRRQTGRLNVNTATSSLPTNYDNAGNEVRTGAACADR